MVDLTRVYGVGGKDSFPLWMVFGPGWPLGGDVRL